MTEHHEKITLTPDPNAPVLGLDEAFSIIAAVGRGEIPPPAWAGKSVFIGEDAKRYWTQQAIAIDKDASGAEAA